MTTPNSNLTNSPNLTNSTNLQLSMDGAAVLFPMPAPRRLTERQRDLLRYARAHGGITTREARRFYADASGALWRLECLGLVRQTGRGVWEVRQ